MKNKGKFTFLGEIWNYKIIPSKERKSYLVIKEEEKTLYFLINEKKEAKKEIVEVLKEFLKKLVKRIIEQLKKLGQEKGLKERKVNRISIKILKSRFGSCSSLNNLNFNLFLLAFKKELIFYVVVHEYCHLYHLNHSKEFWDLVYKFDKDFKKHRKEIREKMEEIIKKDSFWKNLLIKKKL
jgi:predicted metal-dependent hydrolase